MSKLSTQFQAARTASAPLLAVKTPDPASTIRILVTALGEEADKVPILTWDVMHGLKGWNTLGKRAAASVNAAESGSTQPPVVLELMEKIGMASEDAILFMHNAHRFWNNEFVMQAIWNLRDVLKDKGSMLVMLTSIGAELPQELFEDVLVLEEPLPRSDELREIVVATFKDAGLPEPDEKLLTRAVDALIGLSAFAAEQSVALSLSKKGLDIDALWERKRKIIEQTRGMKVWRGGDTIGDIGGCDNVKEFNQAVLNGVGSPRLILFMDEIEKAVVGGNTDLDGGVKSQMIGTFLTWMQDLEVDGEIYIGPPGAAKSAMAKAIGNLGGIPTVQFDFAGQQESLLGSSGENLNTALKIAEAMSEGRILVIATCNSIGSLSPELRRRFTLGTFFFDLPTKEERDVIWKIYLKKYGHDVKVGTGNHAVRPDDEGWTGAEIKECCRKAYRLNITLKQSAEYIVPVSRSAADKIDALREQASGKFISASYSGVYNHSEAAEKSRTPHRRLRVDLKQTGRA